MPHHRILFSKRYFLFKIDFLNKTPQPLGVIRGSFTPGGSAMIVSFSIENWMSFHNKVTLSMVASRERQHGKRVARLRKYQTGILPIAAIYGGNASGKTNLFKALHFAKTFVVRGTQPDSPIGVEAFRLDTGETEQPTRFAIELLIDERIYEFSFAVTRKAILEEKLVVITSDSERTLFDRRDGNPNFDKSLAKDQFIKFAFKGTRDNQLFLTNSVSQKVDNFRPVYAWFKDTLKLIAPDSRFEPFEQFLGRRESPLCHHERDIASARYWDRPPRRRGDSI